MAKRPTLTSLDKEVKELRAKLIEVQAQVNELARALNQGYHVEVMGE